MVQYIRKIIPNALIIVSLYTITFLVFYFAISRDYMPLDDFSFVRLIMLILFVPIITKYLLQLFIAPWYQLTEFYRRRKHLTKYVPTVSVLIPAWNEEVGILKTIKSVLDTKYPRLEIIVINDGSTDGTHEVVTKFIAQYRKKHSKRGVPIKYKRVINGGKARALNIALPLAQGTIVITIDSDSVMDTNAIKNMVKYFNDPRVASVAGNVIIGNRSESIGFIQQLEYMYGFYFKRADSILNSIYIVGGAAAAYRKKIITKLGGFDENMITEDIELSTRIQDNGYRIRYAADATIYTEGPSDFKGLCQQRLRWKFGRLLTFYKYRHLFFSLDRRHNFCLSFLILPIALFAEILLFFQGIMLMIFYTYTFYTNDFVPLTFVILMITTVIYIQIITDYNKNYHRNLFLLAPIAWLLFYFIDLVEYQALMRSIKHLVTREKVKWQKWVRVGVLINTIK